MLKNYFKVAVRALMKYRLYSLINILGLSIGIACCILILLFVQDEWAFDQFHSKADRIYRAHVNEHYEGRDIPNTVVPYILGPTLSTHIPEIEYISRIGILNDFVSHGKFHDEETIHMVEPGFLQLFDFPFIQGDSSSALDDLRQVVITPSIAKKYFSDQEAVGQMLTITLGSSKEDFLVSGIIQKPPANSSIQFDMLIPFLNNESLLSQGARNSWYNVGVETYLSLKEGTIADETEAKFPAMMKQALGEDFEEGAYEVGLQPLADIHLNTDMPLGLVPISDWRYSYILGGIALLILIVACINFMTLSVGRSVKRAREVGIRKVVGARRLQLMYQFWSEAILVALLASVTGILIAELTLPLFNELSGKILSIHFTFANFSIVLFLAIIIGLVSGFYPAAVLSGFSPVQVLRGAFKPGRSRQVILRSLVGLQFVLSVILISSTYIMQNQLRYLQNKNLGFNKEHVLMIPYRATPTQGYGLITILEEGRQKAAVLKNEISRNSEIIDLTVSTNTFGEPGWTQLGYTKPGGEFISFQMNAVDYDYFKTMKMEVIKGRPFQKENSLDKTIGVIVNESFANRFGWENPIGKNLPGPFSDFQVIGVVRDFHFASLKNAVNPLVLVINPLKMLQSAEDITYGVAPTPKISIRFKTDDLTALVKTLETSWTSVAPDQAFSYRFLDETLQQQYIRESRLGDILTSASFLAIMIACMGLFGIVALTITNKTKEIGIRKVIGASTTDIVWLLMKNFTRLVLISFLISIPVVWFLMDEWLKNFAFHVKIGPGVFIISGLTTLLLAWTTVSYQSIKAALADPVNALKSE